jgi:hypothetical protein
MTFTNPQLAQQANFVQFAYNMFKAGGLQPTADPGIAAAGYQLLYWLNGKDIDTPAFYGYLAASTANPGDVVIAIRGTEDSIEWILDFAAIPVHMSGIGFVALGFLSIFNSFTFIDAAGTSSGLIDTIQKVAQANAVQNLIVTGHSLGAALSSLTAAQIVTTNPAGAGPNVTSVTFASPRVGLLDFASHFNNTVKTSYRVWNSLDIVPEVPVFPFVHVSGKGDELTQSESQLEQLTYTPSCEHSLTSYQWLLDSDNFQLDPKCRSQAVHATLSLNAGVSTDRSAGIEALRKSAHGRL